MLVSIANEILEVHGSAFAAHVPRQHVLFVRFLTLVNEGNWLAVDFHKTVETYEMRSKLTEGENGETNEAPRLLGRDSPFERGFW